MFAQWLGPDSSATALAAAAGVLLLALTGVVVAGRGSLPAPEPLEGSLLLLLIPLLSPQGWDYVFLIGTPAVMLLINDAASLPRGLRVAAYRRDRDRRAEIYDLVGRDVYAPSCSCRSSRCAWSSRSPRSAALRFKRAA